MLQPGGRQRLAPEAGHERLVVGQVLGQQLHRHRALEHGVGRLEDGGHAARAEPALDPVAAGHLVRGRSLRRPAAPRRRRRSVALGRRRDRRAWSASWSGVVVVVRSSVGVVSVGVVSVSVGVVSVSVGVVSVSVWSGSLALLARPARTGGRSCARSASLHLERPRPGARCRRSAGPGSRRRAPPGSPRGVPCETRCSMPVEPVLERGREARRDRLALVVAPQPAASATSASAAAAVARALTGPRRGGRPGPSAGRRPGSPRRPRRSGTPRGARWPSRRRCPAAARRRGGRRRAAGRPRRG